MARHDLSRPLGVVAAFFLAALFLGAGLVLLRRAFVDGAVAGAASILPMVVGSVLVLIGLALAANFYAAARAFKRRRQREEAHPHEPWRWREEWQQPELASTDARRGRAAWFNAVAWNAIAGTIAFLVFKDERASWLPRVILLLFLALGVGLLVAAFKATLRQRKFGTTRLVLSPMPGRIGGWLGGAVIVPARLQPESDPQTSARCLRRVQTGAGKNTRTVETVLWERVDRIDRSRWQALGTSSELPFLFEVPPGLPATDDRNLRDQVVWRIEARVAVAGIDFESTFEVPVFPPTTPSV